MSKRKRDSSFCEALIQFTNCRILYRSSLIKDDLWVRNGRICNPEKIFFGEKVQADVKIDCKNLIIAPGFIDVQINGKVIWAYRQYHIFRPTPPPLHQYIVYCNTMECHVSRYGVKAFLLLNNQSMLL